MREAVARVRALLRCKCLCGVHCRSANRREALNQPLSVAAGWAAPEVEPGWDGPCAAWRSLVGGAGLLLCAWSVGVCPRGVVCGACIMPRVALLRGSSNRRRLR